MKPRSVLPLALAAFMLGGCAREEIRSYRAPKEDPMATLPPAMRNTGGDTETAGALTWTAPDNWEEQTAGGMRRGSFAITGENGAKADLSVIAFPGDAGGLAANLNRWRGQIGLPTLTADEVQASIEHIDTPAFHVDFVNYLGVSQGVPTRIAGAILNHGNESWFFKLMGPDELVASQIEAFRNFLQTVAPTTP